MAKYEIKDGIAIIPEGTQKIEDRAFSWCKELTSVVIPDSVTEQRERKPVARCSGRLGYGKVQILER